MSKVERPKGGRGFLCEASQLPDYGHGEETSCENTYFW